MGAYQYQALNASGKTVKGILEADSERHARQLLRDQHLIPLQLQTLKKRTITTHRKDRLTAADLSLLTRQLATLLTAGIPLEESLQGVSEQSEKTTTRQLMMGIRAHVMEGYSLAQSMNEYPNAFPPLYRATVASGEQTGRLDVVLEKLADYTEHQQTTRQTIQQALIYPGLMLIISLLIVGFLLAFVVPNIIEVFTSGGQTLPLMTLVLIRISTLARLYGVYAIIVGVTIVFGVQRLLKQPTIKQVWHRTLLTWPMVGYVIKSVNGARYIHTFGILFAAGVNVLDTMTVSTRLITNVAMQAAFDAAAVRVREGTSIGLALKDTGCLSPMTLHLIQSGEKSGQLAAMMDRAAVQMDREVQRLIDTALALLEPGVILIMGAMVLFIVLATLLPIFSMEQLVS